MLLVIDAGNTNTVFAVFDGSQLMGQWRLSADSRRTADEYAILLQSLLLQANLQFSAITDVIVATVVPQTVFNLKMFCRNYIKTEPLFVGDAGVKLGIKAIIDNEKEVGADRLVNSIAAFKKYGGNVIVVDFGTATNFDVVDANGNFIGGVIAPGVNLSLSALQKAAAKLPEVEVKNPGKVVGTNTISAMQSGMFYGYLAMIEGIVTRIIAERKVKMTVVATGGLAKLFSSASKVIDHFEPDLTIHGLRDVFILNK